MSEGILTKTQDMDGAVIAPPVIRSEDGYNVTSDNVAVLRLEICKQLVTKELSNDCLSIVQQNIAKDSNHGSSAPIFLICSLVIGIILFYLWRFIWETKS